MQQLISFRVLIYGDNTAWEEKRTRTKNEADLLAAGELHLGTLERLKEVGEMVITASCGHDNLTNMYAGHGALGLPESATHTGLQTIGAGTWQHLVDADHVERMTPDLKVQLGKYIKSKKVDCKLLFLKYIFMNQRTYHNTESSATNQHFFQAWSKFERMCVVLFFIKLF